MRFITLLASCLLVACSASKEASKSKLSSNTAVLAPAIPAAVNVNQADVAKDIRYLASDELGGRGTGSAGIEKAATYIAGVFAEASIAIVSGTKRYTQLVPLIEQASTISATLEVADQIYVQGEDLLVLSQSAIDKSAALRFYGQVSAEELSQENLEGTIVVTLAGSKEEGDPRIFYKLALEKQKAVAAQGGLALIELYRSPRAPFSQVSRFLGGSGLEIDKSSGVDIPLIWLNDPKGSNLQVMDESAGTAVKLSLKPGARKVIPASNILGFIEGTDPTLAQEIVVISAHYDHLGIDGSRGGVDSIFNGARDNGLGTAALLGVARHFGTHPGKRPILLAAWTAEEKGLLGSEYFVESPIVPLKNIAYNLNFDGAGYDDTTSVTINGYGRTTAQSSIDAAVAKVGLKPNPDPIPEMNLYQFSDNWSFAKKGIPAMNMAPGFTGFSPELMKYYHQAGDHADGLDFAYVTRYVTAAVAASQAVVNLQHKPEWMDGDALAPTSKKMEKQ